MHRPLIAIAADGVLFDYNLGVERAWQQAQGWLASEEMRHAFLASIQASMHGDASPAAGSELPLDRDSSDEQRLERQRSVEFWSTLPAMPDAVLACEMLVEAGFELVCVAATVEPDLARARLQNLQLHGFAVRQVLISPVHEQGRGRMADALSSALTGSFTSAVTSAVTSAFTSALNGLGPVAVVDHSLPRLQGLSASTHTALIADPSRVRPQDPPSMSPADSVHEDLLHFARWWSAR